MLIGEYTHTLDSKKRISLPKTFRTQLGKKLVITRGLDNCLFLYSTKEWSAISKKIAELGLGQAGTRGFNRFILAGAQEVDVDSLGRILIPEYLKEFANLKNKAVITGVHNRVEIWNAKAWEDYKKMIEKQADSLAEKLGDVGIL